MWTRHAATPQEQVVLAILVCVICFGYQVWNQEHLGTKRQLLIFLLSSAGIAAAVWIESFRSIFAGATWMIDVAVSVIAQIDEDMQS